jgi:hypothetical protein
MTSLSEIYAAISNVTQATNNLPHLGRRWSLCLDTGGCGIGSAVPRPAQAAIPESGLDAFSQTLFEKLEQVVDTQRLDRWFVRARQ